MNATEAPAQTTLELFPTTDLGEHIALDFSANGPDQYCPFTWLLDFAKDHGFSLRHDPESTATVTGYYVEDGDEQVYAAILK